jgi:hypothetical protein
MVVDLLVALAASQDHLVRVDHDDIVAAIHMGCEARLVLAAQPKSDKGGETTDHEALGVDHHPCLLDLGGLCQIGLHC